MSVPVLVLADLAAAISSGVPGLLEVGTARDLALADIATVRWPSAWVVPLSESGGPNRYQQGKLIDQRVEARFGVVLALRDIADRSGARALSEAEAVRPLLIDALGRHQPAGVLTTCLHVRGQLLGGVGKEGTMLWQDDFTVTYARRIG